jgi:hypothetical protein
MVHVLPAVEEDLDKSSAEDEDKQTTEYHTRPISGGGKYDDDISYMYLYANCRLPNQLVDFD